MLRPSCAWFNFFFHSAFCLAVRFGLAVWGGVGARDLRGRFTCLCQITGMRLKSPAQAFAPTQSKSWSRNSKSRSFGLNWDGMGCDGIGWVFMADRVCLDFCSLRFGFLFIAFLDFVAAPSISLGSVHLLCTWLLFHFSFVFVARCLFKLI